MRTRAAEEWAAFLLAAQLLTRAPVPDPGFTPARMAAAARWLPGVGALVGALAALAYWLAALLWTPGLAALAAVATGVLATGAFHEDGFADACDGLGGGATRERALEIMRDSRIGTYGAAGLVLMLGGRVLALAAMPAAAAAAALVAGHALSRLSAVAVIASSTYVRDQGTGRPLAAGIGRGGLAFAAVSGLAAALPLALVAPAAAAAGLGGLALGHAAMRRRFERRLGGYTGDCLGAVQQTSELCFYLGALAAL